MAKSRDLFDNSVMSFGGHLDVLRVHVLRSVIGLVIAVALCLVFGQQIVAFIRQPIDAALVRANLLEQKVEDVNVEGFHFWTYLYEQFFGKSVNTNDPLKTELETLQQGKQAADRSINLEVSAHDLMTQLHEATPLVPAPGDELKTKMIKLKVYSDTFMTLRKAAENSVRPVALNVQEAFMTYLKVSFVAGLVLSSPWIIFQLWLFVAAGLYPHERKYVHIYFPMSIFLFLVGGAFCYYAVFPIMLDFLLKYNVDLGINPQIRISEWITFAVMFPVMFGVSFQLPLVMKFATKINVIQAADFRKHRKIAILLIAIASMFLTPSADPASMILMMIPLIGLYEFGILLCRGDEAKGAAVRPA